eukprot:CAMPEP_0196591356 /NCGR_PEP_ID=MMETSP1081-20130531/69315_1 /TAXON_ID=36882 /ORGANISM="Pyramimonas amylifera, Strain CCMP720" /LENGTH=128 /DNA_ID=CAMNT_0041914689 /DNA_START=255 /DNA_END=641 /DNA_ORIENTATION=+
MACILELGLGRSMGRGFVHSRPLFTVSDSKILPAVDLKSWRRLPYLFWTSVPSSSKVPRRRWCQQSPPTLQLDPESDERRTEDRSRPSLGSRQRASFPGCSRQNGSTISPLATIGLFAITFGSPPSTF